MRFASLAGLALFLTGGISADGQTNRFDDTARVLVVEVPVQVSHKGEPVRGLTADHFELYADGKKQKILDFQEVDLARVTAKPGDGPWDRMPTVARRHFLFLFDLSFARPAGILKAQAAAQELVLEGLHPTDLVGVASYSESSGARVILGFTADRFQVRQALETLGNLDPAERVRDPLGIILADYQTYMQQGGFEQDVMDSQPRYAEVLADLGIGEADDYHPEEIALAPGAQHLNNMKDQATLTGRANRDQVRNQILSLTSAFTELAEHLASVDGRKHIVLFSEGFDSSSLLGSDDQGRVDQLAQESSFGQFWRVDNDERYGDLGTRQGVFDMLDQFKRCDCTIQAVDIGGVRAGGDFEARASGEQSLFVMADQTGGELFRNYNDLSLAMEEVLERTSVTYLLSWQPRDPGEPGRFYPIRVKLKGGPKGARIVHRPGYYAPKPYAMLGPDERRFETLELLMQGREGGALEASVLTAPYPSASGGAGVMTLIEIEGFSLLRGHQGSVLPTEVFAYAIDAEGVVADFLGQAISLDLDKVRPALDDRGFKFLGRLDLPAGDYEVRVLVRNVVTGATATRIAQVSVPDFDGAQAALLPPFFIEPEGSWLLGEQKSEGAVDDYPLTFGGRKLIPAARPYLRPNSALPVLLVAHNLGPGELEEACRLVPTAGGEPIELDLRLEGRAAGGAPGVERMTARIGTLNARPGDYRLEVTLRQARTGVEVSSGIAVRVY